MQSASRILRLCVFFTIPFVAEVASAIPLSCYEEPGTHESMCINEKDVKANGQVRGTELFQGGPKGVLPTSYMLITNCETGVSVLQDAQGVNFGAALSTDATKPLKSLTTWMCAVKSPKKSKSLTM
jgi:hypothetical protein